MAPMILRWFLVSLIFVSSALGGFRTTHEASATTFTNWINVWAPFSGTWNLGNNAPPESHHKPWGGDWSVDYYKTAGNTGYFGISNSNSGNANGWMYSGEGAATSCSGGYWAGYRYKLHVYDDYDNRGWVVIAHVDATDSLGSSYFLPTATVINPWTFVGRTYWWDSSLCYQVTTNAGNHWHFEMKNAIDNKACYSYSGQSNLSLSTSNTLGAVGSNATWTPPYCGGP